MTASIDNRVRRRLQLRSFAADLDLPPGTDVLCAEEPEALADVRGAVLQALETPIGGPPLADLCRDVLAGRALGRPRGDALSPAPRSVSHVAEQPSVVVVVSDNTRPVPYRGEAGLLWPLVEYLVNAGFAPGAITLLVATGTHRVLSEEEMWALFDERVRQAGVRVQCHDATDAEAQTLVGRTAAGSEVFIDRAYVGAGLRILTGLVEPHLMAGFSGGRKSICPGLVNVQTVRDFHGPTTVAHPGSTALCLDGNPCHDISLEIGRMAAADFIVNVTMRQDGRVAGVFAGDMEEAHLAATEHAQRYVRIPLPHEYDVVVVHAGLVGINHYQAEKAADIAGRAVRQGGYAVVVADTTDADPLGTESYRYLLRLLADLGPARFVQAIQADDWQFVHDQWGVHVWAKLFERLPREHLYYYSPQTALEDYAVLPGVDPLPLLGEPAGLDAGHKVARFVSAAVAQACARSEAATARRATVAYLADGPHGIPVGPGDRSPGDHGG